MGQVVIGERFNGPPSSANGGYACAMAAQFVAGPAEVTLRVPPPLEKPLDVRHEDGSVRLLDGETLVAEARATDLDLEVPAPVSIEQAQAAARRSALLEYHPFGTCFVCGTERREGDGMRLFLGPVEGRNLQAAPWIPDRSLADQDSVRFEFVWSVLDCASGSGVALFDTGPCVLARLASKQTAPIKAGRAHAAIGWAIERERRKLYTAAAVYTDSGTLCAVARALWIELTPEQVAAVGTTQQR